MERKRERNDVKWRQMSKPHPPASQRRTKPGDRNKNKKRRRREMEKTKQNGKQRRMAGKRLWNVSGNYYAEIKSSYSVSGCFCRNARPTIISISVIVSSKAIGAGGPAVISAVYSTGQFCSGTGRCCERDQGRTLTKRSSILSRLHNWSFI